MTPTDRRGFCGATDCAALICARDGLPYWRGAWDVWAEQLHPELLPAPDAETTARMALGTHLEGYVLRRLQAIGWDVLRGRYVVAREPYGWLRAQCDGLLTDDDGAIIGPVEVKITERPQDWWTWALVGDEWTRQETTPPGYEIQVRVQLALLRLQGHRRAMTAHLVALDRTSAPWVADESGARLDLDRADLLIRRVEHDQEKWADIAGYVTSWWHRHILGEREPEDDRSDVCRRWRLAQAGGGAGTATATDEQRQIVARWREAKAARSATEDQVRDAEVAILRSMSAPKLLLGDSPRGPRVQVQAAGRGGRCLREYGFNQEE